MLLSASTTQSTLYDQILYSGSPTSFAWVLPIHGTVDVGLSADVLFASFDAITETKIVAPVPNCPLPPNCGFGGANGTAGTTGTTGASTGGAAAPAVTVTKQENVGPYATVQLHSTDSSALENWLAQNGFVITADAMPVIAQYVAEGFDFLAMKLLPNQGVQAMRPVRVTSQGASLSLPLRMASVGTGVHVGITIWIVSDGRYEPQNFPFFYIDESQLIWDWSTNSSNYTTLRARNETALGGKGWEIESSLTLNQQLITNVILSGGQYYGNGGGFGGTTGGFGGAAPSDAMLDYLPVKGGDAGPSQTAEEVRAADIAALFAGIPGPNTRVTRIRSDILHSAMTKDLVLEAAADQTEVSNVRNVTQSINLVCPSYPPCGGGIGTTGGTTGGVTGTASSTTSGGVIGTTASTGTSSTSSDDAGVTPLGGSNGTAAAQPVAMDQGGGGCAEASQRSQGKAAPVAGAAALLALAGMRLIAVRRRRSANGGERKTRES
jgi:hypothetical protein